MLQKYVFIRRKIRINTYCIIIPYAIDLLTNFNKYSTMNKLTCTLLAFFLLSAPLLFSQDILWEKTYGGKHAEYLYDAIPTPDYGFILAGSSVSGRNGNKDEKNNGDLDYFIWKMDEHGNLDWQKSIGGNKMDVLQSIALTGDGGFILGGTSNSDKGLDKTSVCLGEEDFWVIKLDAKGGEMWQKTIGGSGMEKLLSIAQTKDGGYILGGTSSSNKSDSNLKGNLNLEEKTEDSRGNLDYWVLKLKSDGKVEWQKTLGGKYVDELKAIQQTKDGGYILGGYSNSPVSGDRTAPHYGQGDYWIVKLDKDGVEEWQSSYGGDKNDNLFAMNQTQDEGFIVGGNSNSGSTNTKSKTNKKGTDFWVLKLNEIGNIEWQETYNYGEKDILNSIVENEDGTFLIGGYALSEVSNLKNSKASLGKGLKGDKEGINDYIALKIDKEGKEIWTQIVGSNGDEVMKKLLETRDGGYLLAGTSNGKVSRDKNTAKGGNDFWVVKLKDKEKKEKGRINLEAVPNPTEYYSNVIINFKYKKGTATLYDLSGKQIYATQIRGERTIPMELTYLPSGIYIVEIKTDTKEGGVKIIKK